MRQRPARRRAKPLWVGTAVGRVVAEPEATPRATGDAGVTRELEAAAGAIAVIDTETDADGDESEGSWTATSPLAECMCTGTALGGGRLNARMPITASADSSAAETAASIRAPEKTPPRAVSIAARLSATDQMVDLPEMSLLLH